uniref:uncharacterized protein LOC122602302 n=1 Tax=Erigeron canadensis TaxID=72917 RepID=UPI001CB90ED3|nr:uncharacterized protein LOC122602302 [Erigeron canadensis]
MEDESLASLKSRIMARVGCVRALRRWNPRFHTNVTSYVFVDRSGVGIQAIAWGKKDQKHVESLIEVGNYFEIDRYACAKPVKYINALPHETNMRIGFTTLITPLEDLPKIPHHYFNFGTYQKLRDICDSEDEITDYNRRLQGIIEDKTKRDGSPFVTFNIIDISDEPIQVTLWNEIATTKNRFDRKSIEKATGPVIIAVTSMKVSSYSRRSALQSTGNTFVFLNPQTAETEHFLNRLHCDDFEGIRQEQQTTTISEILGKPPSDLQGITFLCKARVQQITSTVEWFRSVCPTCSHEIFNYGENWLCTTGGVYERPIYMYQLSAIREDNTGEIHANINESPTTAILELTAPS